MVSDILHGVISIYHNRQKTNDSNSAALRKHSLKYIHQCLGVFV